MNGQQAVMAFGMHRYDLSSPTWICRFWIVSLMARCESEPTGSVPLVVPAVVPRKADEDRAFGASGSKPFDLSELLDSQRRTMTTLARHHSW